MNTTQHNTDASAAADKPAQRWVKLSPERVRELEMLARSKQAQHSPLARAKRALDGDSNDEEHDALFALVEAHEALRAHAQALADALRVMIAANPASPVYGTMQARQALADYQGSKA